MKLRLPHKFQAALLAAIASVSFTTLSTGTAAYAATTLGDAELSLADFTAASVDAAKAQGWSFSDTGIATASGVYTTTVASSTITSSTPWTARPADAGRGVYAALMTIDVSSLSTNGGVLLMSTFNSDGTGNKLEGIGYDYTEGTYKVESAWAGAKRDAGLINQNLMNYADANGLVTVAIIYKGNQGNGGNGGATIFVANQTKNDTGLKGSDNADGNPGMLLANTTGVKYTNLYMFGMENGNSITDADMQSMMKEAAAYHWNGSTNGNWDATSANWNHYGSTLAVAIGANGGNANTNVIFDAEPENKSVTLGQNTTIGTMAVNGDYTFNLGNHNLTVGGVLSGSGTLGLTGGGTVTLNSANTGYTGNITVDGSTLQLGNAEALGAHNVDGSRTITVQNGGTLDLHGMEAVATGYAVTLNGGTLTNTVNGKGYGKRQVFTNVTLEGDSSIVAAVDYGIIASGYAATSLNLGSHKLSISGSGNFYFTNTSITGSGAIQVETGANVRFNVTAAENQLGSISSNIVMNGGQISSEPGKNGNILKLGDSIGVETTKDSSIALQVRLESNTLTFSGAADLTVGGDNNGTGLVGAGSIVKTGTGTLTLSGTNTYTGATSINAGTLVASSASALGNGSAVSVAAGALLDLNTALTVGSLTLSGSETEGVDGAILKFKAPSSLTVTGAMTFASGSILDVANIEYSTGAITLATAGSIGSIEGVMLRNVAGQYGAELAVEGTTLLLKFGLPDELLVWDNYAGHGGWGSQEGICNNWHDISSPDAHIVYPSGEAKDVRFTAEVQDTAILMEDIAVKTLNVDAGAAANVCTGEGDSTYGLTVDSVAGSGATLNLTGAGTTTVTGQTHLGTLTVAAGTVNLAESTITTLTNNGGTVTVAGASSIATLNASGGTTAINGADAQNKASVGTLNISSAAATAEFTNAEFSFTSGGDSIKGNVTIGAGAKGIVTATDSLNWRTTTDITILVKDGGTLDFGNNRWTIQAHNKVVLDDGHITGNGQNTNGTLDFDSASGRNVLTVRGNSDATNVRVRGDNNEFLVENGGTFTITGNLNDGGPGGHKGGLTKSGAGELIVQGGITYQLNTTVSEGTLTANGAYALAAGQQLQVAGGATAAFNDAVTIGKGATFSVASGGTLTFGSTVAVTGEGQHEWAPEAGTNGFGTLGDYATVGTGATGGTWTIDGHDAAYDSTTGRVGWEETSTTYYIQAPGTQGSTIPTSNITKVVVDTQDTDNPVALGGTAYTAFSTLQIDSGVVTTTHSSSDGVIKNGDIVINAGGTFRVAGEHDAFGYDDNAATRSITLNGTADALATLDLKQTTENSVTMKTNLILNGHARITDIGTHYKGFNTFGGSITASGTDNVIEHMSMRKPVTVTVNSGADLVINTLDNDKHDETRDFTKKGTGTLTIGANTASIATLTLNAGELVIESGTSHIGTIKGTQVDNNNKWNHTLVIGAEPTGSQDAPHATVYATRVEMGNINDGQKTMVSNLVVNEGSTLAITGNSTATGYGNASFVLGEWNVSTTADIKGTVIAENAFLVGGDSGYVMNIDGGTVLVKGLKRDGNKNPNHRINVSNGGKLILGETGITTTNAGNAGTLTLADGTIGVYGNGLVNIEKAIALSGNVTFDTQKHTVSDTTVARGTEAGNLTITGNLSGDAAITKVGAGTLMLYAASGSNTITHTINLQEGGLSVGGSVTVDSASIGKFVKYGEGTERYSDGANGFLTSSAEYYLVQGAENTTLDATGLQLTGGALIATQPSEKDLVFTFDTSTPGGLYYVNEGTVYYSAEGEIATATGFVIKEGAMLSAANGNPYTTAKVLHGAGTYALAGGQAALNSGLSIGSDWTGTVRLSGTINNLNINTLGNNIASTIEFAGMEGSFNDAGTNTITLARDVVFTNVGDGGATPAVKITNGYSRAGGYEFSGNVSGHGTFLLACDPTQHITFSGDVSAWDGQFKVTNAGDGNGGSWVKFTGNANVVNAAIAQTGGNFCVIADTDVQFNKAVTANLLKVTAGNTATINVDSTFDQGITADGAGTVVVGGGTTLTLGQNAWTTPSDNFAANFIVEENATLFLEMVQNDVKTYNGDFTFKNGSTLQKYDGGLKLTGTVTFGETAGDVVNTAMNWAKKGIEFSGLVEGAGTVRLVGKGVDDRYLFSGANGGFTGEMMVGIQANGSVSSDTAYLDISGTTALQHGTINLAGGDKAQLRLANEAVTIGGLRGTAGGRVILKDVSAATLTFSGDGAYEYAGTVGSGISLVMAGNGNQTFNGDLSAMNGTVTATAGTLTLNNTGATRGTLASVTYNGGTLVLNNMDVAGATTIGQGTTLDLGATNLTSAIVNQGTVNFTQNITASGLAKVGEDDTFRVGANDAKTTTNNYFEDGTRTESTIRVVNGGTVNPAGHTVTQDNVAYTLKTDGTATGVTADGVDYRVFYQGQAGSTVSVSEIAATAAKHNTDLIDVSSLGAGGNPTVLNVDQNLAKAQVAFSTVNIASGVEYTGDLLIFGGNNTVSGQIDIARVGFYSGYASVTTFTDAPVVDSGVRFSSDAGVGGVQVQANTRSSGTAGYYEYNIGDANYSVVASELSKEGEGSANVANSLMVKRVHNSEASSTGKLTLEAGAVAASLKEVTATSGDVEFLNMAAANGTSSSTPSLNKLEIGTGKVVSMYTGSVAEVAQEASVTVTGTLTAGAGATLNANLVMGSKSTLDVSATGGAGLLMGSSVTLNPGVTLSDGDMVAITGMGFMDQYTLFQGVDAFSYNGGDPSAAPIAFDSATWVKASEVFSNTEFTGGKDYYLFYGGAENGSNVGAIFVMQIPEPATGTLSLLALAALAARRRRKD